ncbi:alpha/beta-hydrolase [Thozetella sp. PMI_491]|nr:alpha/beta-hydrolase [Thozetella sp. PMI_491]
MADDRLGKLEQLCVRQGNISARWLPGGAAFWYTQEYEPSKFEFVLVNCVAGTRQRAFDHVGLAQELGKQTSKEVNPESLPFSWVNVDTEGAWIRFEYDGQVWQYASGELTKWVGEFDSGGFDETVEGPSPRDEEKVKSSITFINNTSEPLVYNWIDFDGITVKYGILPVRERTVQHSFLGHVWRLVGEKSGREGFCAVKRQPAVANVSEFATSLAIKVSTDENVPGEETWEKISKEEVGDSKTDELFIRDFNVWLRAADGKETQISQDGVADNYYQQSNLYLSGDKKMAAVWQTKPAADAKLHLIEYCPKDEVAPKFSSRKYLRPGDAREIDRPRLFDLKKGKEIPTEDGLFQNPYDLDHIGWSDNDQEYRFLFNERGHKTLRFLAIQRNGTVRCIVEESSSTFVDYAHKEYHKILDDTRELLWASERDGWNHLYLFSLEDGSLKHQVTKGEWVMRSVEKVDEHERRVWFRAFGIVPGQDPYYSHLVRVNLDGTDLKVLTEGDGNHTWKWSPDRKHLIDTWSRLDCPPQTVIRDGETGKKILQIEHSRLEQLNAAGWWPIEPLAAPGRDGKTLMYGFLIRPPSLAPGKKYPVIEEIYAGPQDFYTHKSFIWLPKLRKRAREGYITVMLDGMGTNWRSREFHNVCYKDLKDAGFPDRIAWIRTVASTRQWMDIDRVGIVGSSAGGQNAAAALIWHGDFYKVACAFAGCHDNRVDKLWWNELWMGYPVDDSYAASSNIEHAAKLTGKLLLAVGQMDTNVDPGCTFQLVEALIEADKDFELVVVPKGEHSVRRVPWVARKEDEFFRRHLQEVEDPAEEDSLHF